MEHGMDLRVTGIANLLGDRVLEVPPYQRPFAWERDHVEAFWNDLKLALAEESNYFLGSVVLSNAGDRLLLVDGQQRVTTMTLLLCAIRDYFIERDDDGAARMIETDLLATRKLSQPQLAPRIRLGQGDAFFQSLLLRDRDVAPETEGDTRLGDALATLRSNLDDDLEGRDDPASRCDEWIAFLREQALVIRVAVTSDADAFSIFETLNDRGVALATTDLLRNYLLSRLSGTGQEGYTTRWNAAIDAVAAVGDTQTPTAFIRHYWSGREGATRERDLYRSIRGEIETAEDARALIDEVATAADAYAALLDPSHEAWTKFSSSAASLSSILLHLDLARVRPLVLALMLYGGAGADRMFEALARWLPRGLLSGTIGGSVAERAFASAAQGIRTGAISDTDQLRVSLSRLVPNDTTFGQAFVAYRLRRPQLGSYVLKAIETTDASPFHERPSTISDFTVVPVFSPGLMQQMSSAADADEQRRLDGLKESFGNFVVLEGRAAQALKGATGEARLASLGGLTGVAMPDGISAGATIDWLERRLFGMRERALATWNA